MLDILQKREMLFTIRTRFSPQVQPVKETAIDKIIEQNLLICDPKTGLTIEEIQKRGILSIANGHNVISNIDLKGSIKRLRDKNRILIKKDSGQEYYQLSDDTLKELEQLTSKTENHFKSVVVKLFKNITDPLSYGPPFLRCLSIVFSALGERYVRIIKGDLKGDELLTSHLLSTAIDKVKKEFKSLDSSVFNKAINTFFQESDPEYDAIKWNMAQNYYIAKVIGLEPNSRLLSHELFGNAYLYLDTNVIVSALEEEHEHHRSFRELRKACEQLDIKVKVCQISIDELRGLVAKQRELIKKVSNQIPDETAHKVRGIFFKMYHDRLKSNESVDLNELFSSFDSPSDDLQNKFNIELEDDAWFNKARYEAETNDLARILSAKYSEVRGRPKNRGAAIDDAILIRWLKKKRDEEDVNVGLVTLDTSLPGALSQNDKNPFIITLDALLQWVSPIAVQFENEDDFAAVFSETVKYQLLPRDTFFELKDFLMFADMQMSCKELPAEDVEECIRYIKFNAPKLDVSTPEDREKIHYEVSKFFADPGRKYKQEIERLEGEQLTNKVEYEKKLGEALSRIKELDDLNKRQQGNNENRISNLEREFSDQREKHEKKRIELEEIINRDRLKRSAQWRLFFITVLFFACEGGIFYLSSKFSDGDNSFQKIINAWPFVAIGPILFLLSSWFFIGKERLYSLGWPFTKLLKE